MPARSTPARECRSCTRQHAAESVRGFGKHLPTRAHPPFEYPSPLWQHEGNLEQSPLGRLRTSSARLLASRKILAIAARPPTAAHLPPNPPRQFLQRACRRRVARVPPNRHHRTRARPPRANTHETAHSSALREHIRDSSSRYASFFESEPEKKYAREDASATFSRTANSTTISPYVCSYLSNRSSVSRSSQSWRIIRAAS